MKKTIISILAISIVSIASIFSNANSSFANTYEKTINPTFTINDTLTLSLSSSDLVINDLMPGNASDSNIITINVLSNNPYGYTLNSSVGGTSGTVTYNNRDLNYTGTVPSGSTTPSFTSLDYGSSVSSLNEFGSNQWGYSYLDTTLSGSNNNSTPTWSNYSGLPLYTDETNIATLKESNTVSAISGDNIEFKLGARADNTQGSGEYRNIINFIVTGTPEPKTIANSEYLQEVEVCNETVPLETTYTLKDSRDNQSYTVARLKDGKCWMTKNLNLGNPNSTTNLNPTNSDINNSVTLPTAQTTNDVTWATSWLDVSGASTFRIYQTGNNSYGNLYNWYTATASTGNVEATSGNASGSICPKGWGLPTGTGPGSWENLLNTYNITTTDAMDALNVAPISLVKGGLYFYNWFYGVVGQVGIYWTKTSNYTDGQALIADALDADYNGPYLNARHPGAKVDGYSIRCLLK